MFATGDKEILDLAQIEQMKIMSPRQFWEALKNPLRRDHAAHISRPRARENGLPAWRISFSTTRLSKKVVLFKQTPARAIYKIKKNTGWQKVLI